MRLASVLVALLLALPASAQWSTDPSVNLTIADRPEGQAQPKIVGGFGGFYVSWLGGGGDGYDVYLQRLNWQGVALWAEDGLRIADRSYSSTQDYGLAEATNGDALVAFREDVGGVAQVGVRRITGGGTLAWSLVASDDPAGANAPKIAAMPDGGAVVAWTSGSGALRLQRLDASGAPLWGADGMAIVPPSGTFFLGGLHANPDGSVIVSGQAQLSFASRRLWAQKLDAVGTPLWGDTPVEVFDGTTGALQLGYFPGFGTDSEGGAVFAWYAVSGVAGSQAYVQHIRADGSRVFAQNGIEVATDAARVRFAPEATRLWGSGDWAGYIVAWPEESASPPRRFGVSAQRLSPSGERLWGDAGWELAPLGDAQTSQVRVAASLTGPVVAWATGTTPGAMTLTASGGVTTDSGFWWTTPFKTSATSASRLAAVPPFPGGRGLAAFVWADGEDPSPIKAQHLTSDGALGPPESLPSTEAGPSVVSQVAVAPHPVGGAATVRLSMASAADVRADLVDVLGRRVATLADGPLAAGDHALPLDARALAPGVYVLRVAADGRVATRRVVVAR